MLRHSGGRNTEEDGVEGSGASLSVVVHHRVEGLLAKRAHNHLNCDHFSNGAKEKDADFSS